MGFATEAAPAEFAADEAKDKPVRSQDDFGSMSTSERNRCIAQVSRQAYHPLRVELGADRRRGHEAACRRTLRLFAAS